MLTFINDLLTQRSSRSRVNNVEHCRTPDNSKSKLSEGIGFLPSFKVTKLLDRESPFLISAIAAPSSLKNFSK